MYSCFPLPKVTPPPPRGEHPSVYGTFFIVKIGPRGRGYIVVHEATPLQGPLGDAGGAPAVLDCVGQIYIDTRHHQLVECN